MKKRHIIPNRTTHYYHPHFDLKHPLFICLDYIYVTRKLYLNIITSLIHFLVGAFLEKRVDYSHGFSSVFLVGAFLGKSARLLQWLVFFFFFRQTTDLIAYVPLFTETDKTTQAKSGQRKLSAKGPPLHF